VTVTEKQRRELYNRLGETLGEEHAEVLMDYLPPVGWSDVARRHDIDHLRSELRGEMADLRADLIGSVRQELRVQLLAIIAIAVSILGVALRFG
jgi:hypothetical protein